MTEKNKQTACFGEIVLDKRIVHALTDMGFEEPSPIQSQTIPLVLEGKDVIGQAQTGTGKTVAFADCDSEFSNTPLSVEFTPSSAISVFQMTSNQGKKFLLNQSVSAGKKIVVDFETLSCTVDDASVLSSVSLNSNFADFTIDKNTVLTFNADGRYLVRFEVKKL